jgi:hypothetical protein
MTDDKRLDDLLAALKAEIAIYRREEQECFKLCGPSEQPASAEQAAAQTHGQVAANHADRLDLLLDNPASYLSLLEVPKS